MARLKADGLDIVVAVIVALRLQARIVRLLVPLLRHHLVTAVAQLASPAHLHLEHLVL